MKYLILLLLTMTACCDCEKAEIEECNDPGRQWEYFDYCATIPGTRQHKQSHPAQCPWPLKNNKCYPPQHAEGK